MVSHKKVERIQTRMPFAFLSVKLPVLHEASSCRKEQVKQLLRGTNSNRGKSQTKPKELHTKKYAYIGMGFPTL